jgi:hypothetical protein
MASSAAKAIGFAGLACGVMDIAAALTVYGGLGIPPLRLLQGVATGAIGASAYSGGVPTALLGLFFHFVVAFGAATVFYFASRGLRFLVSGAVLSGMAYGIAVYFFMDRLVVPLSAAKPRGFNLKFMIIGLIIHIFCVGLPIALAIRKFGGSGSPNTSAVGVSVSPA